MQNDRKTAAGIDRHLVDRLKSAFDAGGALDLLQRAVRIPSVTGSEAAFAHFLAHELQALGADEVKMEDFAPGRPNVHAVVRGSGRGHRLLLIGHTDTVHVHGWRERWAGGEREDPFSGAIIDGAVWGRGTADLKAGICSALAAVALLRKSGVEPAADIDLAFIGDEESGEPGSGVSAGIKALVAGMESDGTPRADFAIYVEPTQLDVYTTQIGFLIAEITLTGRSAYFGTPELGADAVRSAHPVLSAIWAYSDRLAETSPHPLVGRPLVLVTGIKGGGYIAVPGECTIDLIVKLLPGQSLDAAAAGLEEAIRGAIADPRISLSFAYPAGRDHSLGGTASEVAPDLAAIALLREAIAAARPGRGRIQGAPYWSEAPFLIHRLGIPTVYCAPGDIANAHTLEEHVGVADYCDGIIAFAAFLASFGRTQ